MYSDVEKIHSGVGDKVAVFLQFFTTFIACFVIAFVTNWKLALVVSIALPILILMGTLLTKVWLAILYLWWEILRGPISWLSDKPQKL